MRKLRGKRNLLIVKRKEDLDVSLTEGVFCQPPAEIRTFLN